MSLRDRAESIARTARYSVSSRVPALKPAIDSLVPRLGMASRASQYRYWQTPQPEGHPIVPRHDSTRSARAIAKRVSKEVGEKSDLIIELGSGDGRLLAALVEAGYTNVMGVEINPHAVAVMRETRPELAHVQVLVGPAEQVLKGFGDDSVRCVVTAATLGHIHPDSADLFDTIARITSLVITVDDPPRQLRRQHPWDLEHEFTSRGMTLRRSHGLERHVSPKDLLVGSTVRVFRRMEKQSTLHDFWRQPTPHGNNSRDYMKTIWRSQALRKLVDDLPPDARILEVGCNVGRNLAYLHENGFPHVEGIEINPHAVELLRETYPELADVTIHVGAAGDVLPQLADDSFDLVFTMAVIEHIHPDESHVFDEMVRVGHDVLAIEPENRLTHRQFPHDVPEIFTARGLTLVASTPMGSFEENANDSSMDKYTAHRFSR
jgi:SAM-dependent methyltransferase